MPLAGPEDVKRYRILQVDFDARPRILEMQIRDDWEPHVQALWKNNQMLLRQGLVSRYGEASRERKEQDFLGLGTSPFSVIAFHNKFYQQTRHAFIIGAYYPALTGVCALGERVLNHLVRTLREDFQHTPQYRKVYDKDSFDNWDLAINTLAAWKVLLPKTVEAFVELRDIRNRALHFDPAVEDTSRDRALSAIRVFDRILNEQFSALAGLPWYVTTDIGIQFVKKEYESHPFVARVVLPSGVLVGPKHDIDYDHARSGWIVKDDHSYENREIDDEEFINLFKEHQAKRAG